MKELSGSMLSHLAVTIIECNFVDPIGIYNDKIVPLSCWIGALFTDAVAQLGVETHIFNCCMLEKNAIPALKVNNKATSNMET
jgi:hypothetical protein